MKKNLLYAIIFAMAALFVTSFGQSGDEAPSEGEPEDEPDKDGGIYGSQASFLLIGLGFIMAIFRHGI